ncbi:hypothetical protein BDQ17DRAFT_1545303 [Cyathus striatus]|nr:hypothetical protein BDQ17DRAFT_1545303 [Cyathus striatus]
MSRNSTAPIIPVPQAFIKQYGAQMIASQINATLYGIGLLMVIQYFMRHGKRDPWFIKGTVGMLCLLATLETVFTDHQNYANFVRTFGQYSELNNMVWSVSGKFLFVYLTSFVAQVFFAWCIWIMSRSLSMRYRILIVPVVLLAAMQISSGIGQVFLLATSHKYSALGNKKFWNARVTGMQGAATAACDILITISLILISRANSSGSRSSEESLTSKIVKYSFNRVAATSICAILYVVLFYRTRGTYYFTIPCLASTHINVVSVTHLLMSRDTLREEIDRTFNNSESTRAELHDVPTMVNKSEEMEKTTSHNSVYA